MNVAPLTGKPGPAPAPPGGPASWRPPRADVALAAVVTLAQLGFTALASAHQSGDLGVGGLVLLAVGPVALAWRRRFPVAVLAIVFATTLAYWVAGFARGPAFFALIVAFGTVVLAGHRRVAWASLGLGFVCFLWLGPLIGTEDAPGLAGVLGLAAWLLVLAAAAEILRSRRERAVASARAAEEERRARASEERLRIARELHDVVAHNLSLINVQAGAALHVLGEHPDAAAGALAAIKEASKAGLDELRSLLDVLRADSDTDVAPRVPTPTLADLDGLVERTTAAGVPVELRVDGTVRPLPRSIESAAFRVTQEALTNVVRHAGRAHTVVHLSYEPGTLVVEIDDDGSGASEAHGNGRGAGKGLTGMRERVQALGGGLEAGRRAGRGFRVRAWIPISTGTS